MLSTQLRQEVLKILDAQDPDTVTLNGTLTGKISPSVDVSGLDLSGNPTLPTVQLADRGWTFTGILSATSASVVGWTAGVFTSSDGVTYALDAGTTGVMSARTFIYLDITVSETELQISTDSTDAIGVGKVLIGVAENGSNQPFFQLFGGTGGINGVDFTQLEGTIQAAQITTGLITSDMIAANTIVAGDIFAGTITSNEIAANTIVAGNIAATTITGAEINATFNLSTKNLTADTGTIGGWTLSASYLRSGGGANTVGLDSGGSNPAFHAGSATPASAPFRVNQAGDLVATSATITGTVTATTGAIGGWTLSSTALTSGSVSLNSSTERLLLGSASAPLTGVGVFLGKDGSDYEFRAGNPAGNYVHWDGSTLTIVGTVSGTIDAASLNGDVPLANQNIATQGWTYTGAFTSSDADTVAWASGTLTTAEGTAYSITGSNTGNMTSRTYIYLDIGVSTTAFQATTTAATAVGTGKILVAVAQNATGAAGAFFQVFGGIGGLSVTANEIAANSITTNQIAASTIVAGNIAGSTITGTQISSLSISGKSITADTGTVGGWTLSGSSLSSGNFTINATNEEIEIGSATAPMTGTGIWIGKDGSDYEFRAGNPAGSYIHWNGSTLAVIGDVQWLVKTFTPSSWTGFSASPSGDVSYVDLGTHVILWNGTGSDLSGTSNATNFIMNGLPAAITPSSSTVRGGITYCRDNSDGSIYPCAVNVTSGGTVNFIRLTASGTFLTAAGLWTAANSKAWIFGASVMYAKT